MLSDVLQQCNERISQLPCCNKDENHVCNCVGELAQDYDMNMRTADTYNCLKKMNTYVIRYGASYASEIYHYLVASDFESKIREKDSLTIKSLGCGFSPDYYAIKKYFHDYKIDIPISYIGLDNSDCWNDSRLENSECNYLKADLTEPFDISNADIIFIGKVFSTLYRNRNEKDGWALSFPFLKNLKNNIKTLKDDAIIVFIDVNHQDFGRDCFHNGVGHYFSKITQYYFNPFGGCYKKDWWKEINKTDLVFNIPYGLRVEPIKTTVIFEYRK